MEVPAENYFQIHNWHYDDSNRLIDKIIEDFINIPSLLCLDIGCGDGFVTYNLSQRLKHCSIVAIDVDHEMIKIAKENHSSPEIAYLCEDFNVQWNQLSNNIKELSGSVQMIFANSSLHWMNPQIVCNNIGRLLAPNGKLYAIITIMQDQFSNLPPEERLIISPFFDSPSEDKQISQWKNALSNAKMSNDTFNCNDVEFRAKESEIMLQNSIAFSFIKKLLKEKDPKLQNDIISKYGYIIQKSIDRDKRKISDGGSEGQAIYAYSYMQCQIISQKIFQL